MLSAHDNRLVTETGSQTPAGQLMRQFWQPVALSDELATERPVVALEIMGEHAVLFRNERGQLGLIDRHCPHRGADLAYGRCEDGGLRCVFHGWLFDTSGQCLEQPGEPIDSDYHTRVRAKSYPVVERNGVIFAWWGEGDAPPLPALDCLAAPGTHSFAFKGLMECNWLQALEVGIDPVHASFLHRFLSDEETDASYGRQFRAATATTDIPLTQLLRNNPRPRLEVRKTAWGLRITALRDLGEGRAHVRVTNQLFPNAIIIPMSDTMCITQWHVPVNDRQCYWFAMFTSYTGEVDAALMREQRLALYELPHYRPRVGQHNNYCFSAQDQRNNTYTGMGDDINVHDQWAVESMGTIADRTREHLGRSDVAIRLNRQVLLEQLKRVAAGAAIAPEFNAADDPPVAVDALGDLERWDRVWREAGRQRRIVCPWQAPRPRQDSGESS
jgi:phthalate 4,5-dioxygenase oxygenase subunit